MWTKIDHIEQVEVQERFRGTTAHQEVVKPIEVQHLAAALLEVEHLLQDIVAHEVVRQEPQLIEAQEAEPEATVVVLEHNHQDQEVRHQVEEALTDLVVLVEAVEEVIAFRADLQEAQVLPSVREFP